MTLERALNNLIEKEGRGKTTAIGEENEDDDSDEPIMMKGSMPGPSSSSKKKQGSSTLNSNSNSNSGVSITPKVLTNRLDPDQTTTSTPTEGPQELTSDKEKRYSEKEKEKEKEKDKKKKAHNRISNLFRREGASPSAVPEVAYNMEYIRPSVQPSKTGVLSNLLKLQGKHTQEKVTYMIIICCFVPCRRRNIGEEKTCAAG